MAQVIAFFNAHGKDILLAVLAIDSALIPLFPNAGLLAKIKDVLSSVTPKAPAA